MTRRGATRGALAGVVGPLAFITTWAALGSRQPNYSPIADPISRLAAIDAPTSVAMTGGFLAFAAGVLLYSRELRVALPGPAARTAATAGAASIGIAATPLGSALGGTPHTVFAGIAYAALAMTPILGGHSLGRQGRRRASMVSIVVGVASAASLTGSTFASPWGGLLQRLGLTLGDTWIIGTAWLILPRSNAGTSAPNAERTDRTATR